MKSVSPSVVNPYLKDFISFNQAVIGIELGSTDISILEYLNYFSESVPFNSMYFIKVVPKFDIYTALFEKQVNEISSAFVMEKGIIKRMESKVKSELKNKDDIYIEFDVLEGQPLKELVQLTEDTKADLLVIGQSKSTDYHAILAKNLIEKTPCDALIIPENTRPVLSHIVVPIDFSLNSARALQKAVALKRMLSTPCKITALHVYNTPNFNYWKKQHTWQDFTSILEANIKDGFEAFLHTNIKKNKDQVEIAIVRNEGFDNAKCILDYSKQIGVDFMVLGVKGHSEIHRVIMGSVAESIVKSNKELPVFIVK